VNHPQTIGGLPSGDLVLRTWDNPLGDTLHAKLNRLVGPNALQLEFDCDDADFAAAITSRWPHRDDPTNNLVYEHVGLMQLVDNLNQLVRLYAIESGHTHIRVIIEARRGIVRLPSWWVQATCLFATFGLNTQAAEACIATSPAAAFDALPLMDKYNRLFIGFGPGTPEHLRNAEGIWEEADEKQLQSLQRWEQQLSQQLARLLTYTFSGGMADEEMIVDALATMRGSANKVRSSIESAMARRKARGTKKESEATSLSDAITEIKSALKNGASNTSIPAPARAVLRHSLGTLNGIEQKAVNQPYMEIKGMVRIRKMKLKRPKRKRTKRMKTALDNIASFQLVVSRPDDDFDAPRLRPALN